LWRLQAMQRRRHLCLQRSQHLGRPGAVAVAPCRS